jgi:cytochrome c peroxidase
VIGWRLFFDPQLSGPGNFSCASCHNPDHGFADGQAKARGVYGDPLPRHTPRLANLRGAELFFWDGRATSLEEQVLVPLTHPQEMDISEDEIVQRVTATPHYQRAFSNLSDQKIQLEDIAEALAAFVRSLETGETPFDRWLAGESDALSSAAGRGRLLFFTRGQCATCHIGHTLTDHDFHNIGTGTPEDPGRVAITGLDTDRGRFKTPSLRGWRGSEPFMHDGRFNTIRQVIDHYSEPIGHAVGTSELAPLELSSSEKDDLLSFLETLNGPDPDLKTYAHRWQSLALGSATAANAPGSRKDFR